MSAGSSSRRRLSRLTAALVVLAIATAGLVVTQSVAAAALPCSGGSLYATTSPASSSSPAQVVRISQATGAIQQVIISPAATVQGNSVNQLGIASGGTYLYYTDITAGQVVEYNANTSTFRVSTGVFSSTTSRTIGAVNPLTGIYYYGGFLSSTQAWISAYNPTTNTSQSVAVVNLAAAGGNGDMAFDAAGNLYIVSATSPPTLTAALVRVNGTLPTTGPAVTLSSTTINSGIQTGAVGMAFGSDGYLYMQNNGTDGATPILAKVDPTNGAILSKVSLTTTMSDLASCSPPDTLQAQASFPGGRVNATDQATLTITGNGLSQGNTATTQGTDTGLQNTAAETAGPVVVLPGVQYTVTQTGAAGTNLNAYQVTYSCTDPANGGTVIASGSGNVAAFSVNTSGATVQCVFTDVALAAATLNPDTATTAQGVAVTVNPLTNDTAGAAPLEPATVRLVDSGGNPVTSLTNAQGTYTVNTTTGAVTFTPVASFVGTASPVTYQVADQNGTVRSSTITVTVFKPPTANPDTATTGQGQSVNVSVLGNDVVGSAPFDPSTVRLLDAGGNLVSTLTTAQGTYTVNPANGRVLFAPAATFTGTTPAVTYQFADQNGLTARSTLTVTVFKGPTLNPDTATTLPGNPVTVNPLTNDVPGDGALDPTTVKLVDASGALVTTLTTAAGAYAVNTTTGVVTFTPAAGFTGTAPAVTYQETDKNGQSARSTITVTVPKGPTANADNQNTKQNTPVTFDPLANDTPGDAPLDPTTVKLLDGTGAAVTSLTTAQGTFAVNATTGAVTFTPVRTFYGTTPAVTYRVADKNGQTAQAPITVTVAQAKGPTASPDTVSTGQDVTVVVNQLANDVAGDAPIDPTTVKLVDGTGALVTTLTTAQGTYSVDPATGRITFDPVPTFTGTAPPVTYQEADTNGNTARSTVTVTVSKGPALSPDTALTGQGVAVAVNPLDNDVAGSAPLDPTTVKLLDAGGNPVTSLTTAQGTYTVNPTSGVVTFAPVASYTGTAPAVTYRVADTNGSVATSTITVTVVKGPTANPDSGLTGQGKNVTVNVLANDIAGDAAIDPTTVKLLDGAGNPVTSLTTAQGTYTVDPVTGAVTFAPVASFTGAAPAVNYQVADKNGVTAKSTLTVTVVKNPVANPDTATTFPGNPVAVNPLTNDVAGDGALDPTTVRLVNGAGALVTTLTTAAGAYAVNTTTGVVTFTPAAGFTGTAPAVTYQETDKNGQSARSTITVTVPKGPTANADNQNTKQNTPVTFDPLANDTPGDAPLDPTTVKLLDGSGNPVTSLTTAQGTFAVNATTGAVTFTPVRTFYGTTPAVTYRVADKNGQTAQAPITVTVAQAKGPTASPDTVSTGQDVTVVVNQLANDVAGDAPIDPTTVKLVDGTGALVTTLTTAQGTYTVDPVTGYITFDPVPTFTGTAPPVTYQEADTNGNTARSTVTVTVNKAPVLSPDTALTGRGVPVAVDPLDNDTAGDFPLDPTTVKLVDGTGALQTSLTTAQGTYTVNPTSGVVTFAPVASYTGTAPAVTYQVADKGGQTRRSTITVTVVQGPTANPDTATTGQGQNVRVNVLTNDVAGDSPIVPTTVRLLDAGGAPVTSLTTPQGVYTVVTAVGAVTFAPAAGFTGTTPAVGYQEADQNGVIAKSTITVTVFKPPTANPDAAQTNPGTPVTVNPLANDVAGDGALDPTTVRLVDGAGALQTTLTTAAGTYAVNTTTGVVTFTPAAGFTGVAPAVTYQETDKNGQSARSTITVTVPKGPTANADSQTTKQNTAVTFNPLANDAAGDAPLDPTTVKLLDGSGNPVTSLTTAQGTFAVDPTTGTVTFTPVRTFFGTTPAVTYRVADTNGQTATAPITVTVAQAKGPTASPTSVTTGQDVTVTVDELATDVAGDAPIDRTTVALVDGTGALVTTLTTAQGTYTVDPVTGKITFDPVPTFTGTAPPVTYQEADLNGNTARSTVTVTVNKAPVLSPDTALTGRGVPVAVDPLDNDTAGTFPLDPTTVKLVDGTGALQTSLTTAQGTYTVNPTSGVVTFAPVASYTGTAPAVTYQVADKGGQTRRSTITVTVVQGPTANPDTATTGQGQNVRVYVPANDTAGDSPIDPATVRLLDASGNPVSSLATPQGTYTLSISVPGAITFTPLPSFTGVTSPVGYRVADQNGVTAQSTLTVTVFKPPTANPDTAQTNPGTPVTVNPLANDVAGDGALNPAAVRLVNGAGALVTSLTTAAGTYAVNTTTGTVTFTPAAGFTGTAPAVTYQVTDANGQTARSTLRVTVPRGPTANADNQNTKQNTAVTFDPLANDTAGDAPLDPTTVKLLDSTGAPVTSLTIGAGTYTVDPTTGAITFTPVATFTGTTPAVTYRVADKNGQTAQAPITVSVAAAKGPTASPSTASTGQGVPVTVDELATDQAGDAPIDPTAVKLVDGSGALVTTLTTAEGTYSVDPATGKITFTPVPSFTGTAPPVTYQEADTNGNTSRGTVTITVLKAPVVNPDTALTGQGLPVTLNPLDNDVAGDTPLDPTSVKLVDGTGARVTSLTTPQGAYTVDPATGAVTFTPATAFTGVAPAVTYQVTDKSGQTRSSTITVTVVKRPTANPDTAVVGQGQSGRVDPLANDVPGDAPLDPVTVRLVDPTGALVTSLTTADGLYTVGLTNGNILFVPVASFTGLASPVTYQVTDTNGQTARSTVTYTVVKPPTAKPDTAQTNPGTTVSVNVLANDVVGDAPLDPTSVRIVGLSGTLRTTVTRAQGTYTVDPTTGAIAFTPAAGFTGVAPDLTYQVTDRNGQTAQSTLTVTVPKGPAANEDDEATKQNTPVTFDPLADDAAGDAPLDPTTVALLDGGGNPVTSLTTPQGTFAVNTTTGAITFTPVATFFGTTPAVTYRVADKNGQVAQAPVTVTVSQGKAPTAEPDTANTGQNAPVTVDVLANDAPGDAPLDPTAVKLVDGTGALTTSLTTAEGTYTVDPTTGKITFAPVPSFTGPAAPVNYRVADTNGNTSSSTLTVTVFKPATLNPDTALTGQGSTTTIDPLANDVAGDSPLDPTTVALVDGTGALVTTLTTPQGTYTVNPTTGAVTFAPVASFTGVAPAVTYQAADKIGQTRQSTITVTVVKPPTANPDSALIGQGETGTVNPLTNDVPGDAPLNTTTVKLIDASGNPVTTLTTPDGTYTVGSVQGLIAFVPVASFTGVAAPVTYRVTDQNGQTAQSMVTFTVVKLPTANPDTAQANPGTTVAVNVLANDVPGDAPLDPTSVRIVGLSGALRTTVTRSQGTYTVDPTTGAIAFTPAAGFTGVAPDLTYQVTDQNGQTARSTLSITVPRGPTANADDETTKQNTPLTFDPLANDAAGDAPLDPTTVKLIDGTGAAVTSLTTAEGTFTVDPTTGAITFTPVRTFFGTTPDVTYRVADKNGQTAEASITVTVAQGRGPTASPTSVSTGQDVTVTVDELATDVAGDAPIDPTSVRLVDGTGALVTTLTTPEGTYSVDPVTGKVTFDPVPTFTGTAPPVTYQEADTNGNTARGTVTVTVLKAPTVNPDTALTGQGLPVTVQPLANDVAGDTPLDPTTVKLVDGTGALQTSLTTAEGVYTVDPASGAVTFTPASSFTGLAPAVTYQVADKSGQARTSTITVNVVERPTANPDTALIGQGQSGAVNPLTNDVAGDAPLDPTSVKLLDATGAPVTTSSTAQGTYTVDPATGVITFSPDPAFTGVTAPVTYRVTDGNGQTAQSTVTFTVVKPPTANPDTAQTNPGTPVTVNVLANDVASDAPLDPTSVRIVGLSGALRTTVTRAQGTYTVDPVTGAISFTPAVGFTGVAPDLTYQVTDQNGQTARSTLSVTVPKGPTANGDDESTKQDTAVTFDPLANDTAGDAPLDPTTVKLLDGAGNPVTSLTVPQGTFAVNPTTGAITFTPVNTFYGTTPAVTYRVADTNGQVAQAPVTVTVSQGKAPTASPTTTSTNQDVPVTVDVLADDVPGDAPFDPTAVKLVDGTGALVTTLTTAEGTYTVDPVTGKITFDPVPTFTGTTPPVTYQEADTNGNTARSTITATVFKAPTATPDKALTGQGVSTTIDPLANDTAGDFPLDPTTVELIDGTGAPVTSLTTAEGVYTVDPATGAIEFAPAAAFTGVAPAVTYQVADTHGQTARATVAITVVKRPTLNPDGAIVGQGQVATVDVLANDLAGDAPLDPTTVKLIDVVTGQPLTRLSTPEGTYDVDPVTGAITFTPVPTFTGAALPRTYQVTDKNGQTAQSRIAFTVVKRPTANPDSTTTGRGQSVVVDPLANDVAGDGALDPTTVKLLDGAGNPVQTLTTAAGTYTVDPTTGRVTFAPDAAFTGAAPPVTYQVTDKNGQTAQSTIAVTVFEPPTANPDTATTGQGVTGTIDPLANDVAGDAPLAPTTVALVDATGALVSAVSTPEGQYSVDPTTGKISFTPDPAFTGTAPPVTYQVADKNGQTARSTVAFTVAKGPSANPDTVSTGQGKTVTVDPVANDVAGGAPLDPTTVKLFNANGDPVSTLTTSQGVFTVDPATGKVTFAPAAAFTGVVPPVSYSVADKNGSTSTSTISVTVFKGPAVNPDTVLTGQGLDATINPLANDVAGDAPLDPTTVKLIDGTGAPVTTLTTPAGTYTVDPSTGKITFVPDPASTGPTPPVTYQVTDGNGQTGQSTVTFTVTQGPTANPDTVTTASGTPVTIDPLANDVAGGAPLDPTAVKLIDGSGHPVTTVTTPAGTYTVDPTTGKVTFTPDPGFSGVAPPVTVQVADKNGSTAQSTITVTVAKGPTVDPDTPTTDQGVPVTFDPLANDVAGNAPLDPTTVKLIDGTGAPVSTLTTSAGTFTVDPTTGKITFAPDPAFTGPVPPVTYQVTDKNGQTGQGTINVTVAVPPTTTPPTTTTVPPTTTTAPPTTTTVPPTTTTPPPPTTAPPTTTTPPPTTTTPPPTTVPPTTTTVPPPPTTTPPTTTTTPPTTTTQPPNPHGPTANPDTPHTDQGKPVTVDPLANDVAGDSPLDPTAVRLVDDDGKLVTKLVRPEGVYTVDPKTGVITFAPDPRFCGVASPVTYQVADQNGQTAQSTITVTVEAARSTTTTPPPTTTKPPKPTTTKPAPDDGDHGHHDGDHGPGPQDHGGNGGSNGGPTDQSRPQKTDQNRPSGTATPTGRPTPAAGGGSGNGSGGGGDLPFTGAEVIGICLLGLGALTAGATLLLANRRRRRNL